MRIYLAPLFTAAERLFNVHLADALARADHAVWLPQLNEPREKTPASIFEADMDGLRWCDVVVACMDGPDPDSGTAWECGWASATGKPVILFRTDVRSAPFNLMLTESARVVLTCDGMSTPDIATKISMALNGLSA